MMIPMFLKRFSPILVLVAASAAFAGNPAMAGCNPTDDEQGPCRSTVKISCIGPDLKSELTAMVGCRIVRDLVFRIDGELVVDAAELQADEFDRPDFDLYRIERGDPNEGFHHGEFAVFLPKRIRPGTAFQAVVQEFTIDGGSIQRLNCQAK